MKKLFYIVFGALFLAGCGGKRETAVADSDSIEVQNPIDTVAAMLPTVYLTADSIGPIHINMPINDLPAAVEGIYTARVYGSSPDAVAIDFNYDDRARFVAYDFGEGKVDVINLIGSEVKVKTLKGDIGIGDKMADVLDLPGVSPEWSGYDGSGMWYWKWEGIWFAPTQENLSETLSQRLYHSGQAPTIKDFQDENVSIGFIGTGLPF